MFLDDLSLYSFCVSQMIKYQYFNQFKTLLNKKINDLPVQFPAEPILEDNTHVNDIEYSPLVCGFGITLNDGRAAYLTAPNLKFDPNVSILQMDFINVLKTTLE